MKNKQGGGELDLLERVMHNRFFRGTALFVRRYFDHRVARDSAALTYYLLFAMFPLLIFLSNLVGFFAVDIEGFLRQLGTIIPAEVLDLLIQYLRYVSRVSSRTLMTFSLIFSIWFPMRAANALLLSAAKRGGEVLVPNGHFVPQAGDRVYAIGTPTETARVLRSMGRDTSPIRQLSVIGGGRIALYLAWALDGMGMHITIVEQNEEKCMAIAEKLPKATILHGDGTDHDLLESEGIFDADAFVSLTGRDEENLLMALTAKDSGVAKVLPKMSRPNYTALVHDLGIDTVISPKDVTASQISSYVRGLANSQGSAVESLHKILGGAMEAVEFTATGATHFLNTPLKDLNFKPGLLVAAIVHGGKLLIPGGHSIISEGDRGIVVAISLFLKDLNDILVR